MSLLQAGFGSSGDDYEITDSLRLRSSASAYLSRTPSSTSDRTEWTWSGWVKKGPNATNLSLFSADHAGGSNAYLSMLINNSDEFQIFEYTGSAYTLRLATNALFRDPSAWYHFVCAVDTDQGTDTNRIKLYVNGVQQTSLRLSTYPSSGHTTYVNVSGNLHAVGATVGASTSPDRYLDGYLTEVNFIDGQQLTPTDFGEYDDNGTWKPLAYTGTYGTNGFYLPMKPTTQATGQNTVIFEGNDAVLSVDGVGFSPDLVWLKDRDTTGYGHQLFDTVRGVTKYLSSNGTGAEGTSTGVTSFDVDGFTLGSSGFVNRNSVVAWCWDAGSGSPVSNTVGTIPSTLKANTATGFSIVSYTGNSTDGATIGHGLNAIPSMVIVKARTQAWRWMVYFEGKTSDLQTLILDTTAAVTTLVTSAWSTVDTTSSVFGLGNNGDTNGSGNNYIAYCFAEVAGYSKIGTYQNNNSTTGVTVTTGFRPAFIMVKCTDAGERWFILDNTRQVNNVAPPSTAWLVPNDSAAEGANGATTATIDFLANGFQIKTTNPATGEVSFGTRNYIYMAFADTTDARFNFDASGNQNNWEPNNINSNGESETTYDLMKDTPSLVDENAGNFAVLNPLNDPRTYVSYSDGNLTAINTTSAAHSPFLGTIGMAANSGKYYWEVIGVGDANTRNATGIGTAASMNSTTVWGFVAGQAGLYIGGGASVYFEDEGTTGVFNKPWVTGDVIKYAYDANTGKFWAGQNNVWYNATGGTTGDPATGANPTATLSNADTWFPGGTVFNQGVGSYLYHNFGQRPFAYTPPSGFLKLNTFNLPDSTIEKGDDYFNTVLYNGNGTSQAVTVDWKPDLVWLKSRNATHSNRLVDIIRGVGNELYSDQKYSTGSDPNGVTAFNTTGFSVGSSAAYNGSGLTFVSWNWLASNTTATNSAGANGATIASTYSANTTSGFSISTHESQSGTYSFYHGLGVAPSMFVFKNMDASSNWTYWQNDIEAPPTSKIIYLNATNAVGAAGADWLQSVTSNVIQLTSGRVHSTSGTYVTYAFAEVPGYSAFGSYTGNGSADGPFIYTGFRPTWIMFKRTNGINNWQIYDSTREPSNVVNDILFADKVDAEVLNSTNNDFDLLSNGFKLRNTSGSQNASGGTYIYMAFAENPFKNSNAR